VARGGGPVGKRTAAAYNASVVATPPRTLSPGDPCAGSPFLTAAALGCAALTPRLPRTTRPQTAAVSSPTRRLRHDSVGLAEEILKDIGPKHGLDVTCYRFTRDPKAPDQAQEARERPGRGNHPPPCLEDYAAKFRQEYRRGGGAENCGRGQQETLAKFRRRCCSFTTATLADAGQARTCLAWVKKGQAPTRAPTGPRTRSYKTPAYGELVGAYS